MKIVNMAVGADDGVELMTVVLSGEDVAFFHSFNMALKKYFDEHPVPKVEEQKDKK